eukprot:3371433-Rhodomonas_salina.1
MLGLVLELAIVTSRRIPIPFVLESARSTTSRSSTGESQLASSSPRSYCSSTHVPILHTLGASCSGSEVFLQSSVVSQRKHCTPGSSRADISTGHRLANA